MTEDGDFSLLLHGPWQPGLEAPKNSDVKQDEPKRAKPMSNTSDTGVQTAQKVWNPRSKSIAGTINSNARLQTTVTKNGESLKARVPPRIRLTTLEYAKLRGTCLDLSKSEDFSLYQSILDRYLEVGVNDDKSKPREFRPLSDHLTLYAVSSLLCEIRRSSPTPEHFLKMYDILVQVCPSNRDLPKSIATYCLAVSEQPSLACAMLSDLGRRIIDAGENCVDSQSSCATQADNGRILDSLITYALSKFDVQICDKLLFEAAAALKITPTYKACGHVLREYMEAQQYEAATEFATTIASFGTKLEHSALIHTLFADNLQIEDKHLRSRNSKALLEIQTLIKPGPDSSKAQALKVSPSDIQRLIHDAFRDHDMEEIIRLYNILKEYRPLWYPSQGTMAIVSRAAFKVQGDLSILHEADRYWMTFQKQSQGTTPGFYGSNRKFLKNALIVENDSLIGSWVKIPQPHLLHKQCCQFINEERFDEARKQLQTWPEKYWNTRYYALKIYVQRRLKRSRVIPHIFREMLLRGVRIDEDVREQVARLSKYPLLRAACEAQYAKQLEEEMLASEQKPLGYRKDKMNKVTSDHADLQVPRPLDIFPVEGVDFSLNSAAEQDDQELYEEKMAA